MHEAVVSAGACVSGATVHLVEAEYDQGPILRQQRVDVAPTDTSVELAERVAAIEGPLVVDTLAAIGSGEIDLDAVWRAHQPA